MRFAMAIVLASLAAGGCAVPELRSFSGGVTTGPHVYFAIAGSTRALEYDIHARQVREIDEEDVPKEDLHRAGFAGDVADIVHPDALASAYDKWWDAVWVRPDPQTLRCISARPGTQGAVLANILLPPLPPIVRDPVVPGENYVLVFDKGGSLGIVDKRTLEVSVQSFNVTDATWIGPDTFLIADGHALRELALGDSPGGVRLTDRATLDDPIDVVINDPEGIVVACRGAFYRLDPQTYAVLDRRPIDGMRRFARGAANAANKTVDVTTDVVIYTAVGGLAVATSPIWIPALLILLR